MDAEFTPKKLILSGADAYHQRIEGTLPRPDPFTLATDEFRLPSKRVPDIHLTSNFIEHLQDLDGKELGKIRVNLGFYVGGYLKILAAQGHDGVVTAETYCPGMISSALTLAKDASNYFEGSLIASNPRAATAFHGQGFEDSADKGGDVLNRRIFDHLKRRSLPGELLISVIGNLGGRDENWVRISVGGVEEKRSYPLFLGGPDPQLDQAARHEILQERAAIAALHLTGLWIGDTLAKPAIRNRLHHPAYLKELAVVETTFLDDIIGDVVKKNKLALSIIGRHAKALENIGFMTAESVTGGNLGKLLATNSDLRPLLSGIYVFYDEGFKDAIGVPSRLLTPENIGSGETVSVAADQLRTRATHGTTTTIATSGFASLAPGQRDFFSVGICDRTGDVDTNMSLSMDVTLTKDLPKSNGRKELTKRLAVTAAAILTARALAKRDSDFSTRLVQVAEGLERFLLGFGDIRYG